MDYLRHGELDVRDLTEKQKEDLVVDLDYYQITVPSKFIRVDTINFEFHDDDTRVVRKGTGHCGVLGHLGFSKGIHKWSVVLNSITSSYWVMVGVGRFGTTTYATAYGVSSQNKVYPGDSACATGNWMTDDVIECTLDCDEHTLKIELKRTNFSHTCVNISKEKMFPFVDVYQPGLSVSIKSE